MLMIEVDSAAVEARIEALAENVTALKTKVPDEFIEWQREDMNRRYPTIEENGQDSWSTSIWPRSRLQRRGAERRRRRLAAPMVVRRGVVTAGGGRPILRPELFEMLRERMRALLDAVMPKK